MQNPSCLLNELLQESAAALVINTTAFASNSLIAGDHGAGPSRFSSVFKRPIPVLQLILSSSTEQDWLGYSQGLRSRDIAMQVALPEMDGRIITRAVSFKSEQHYNTRAQFSVVRYALHAERARFVASFAANLCRLGSKANGAKRIAVVLANYPTKDGRIGNGVGLDTGASTLTLLQAMATAGYPVEGIPADGTALVALLQTSITNNPDTLARLPCWQSMALDAYQACFAQLPRECQQAVVARWGRPQHDPRCREGRLMLAGVRLGETFVGLQPARGYNLDLTATYHDPDLAPPHSYLAFYFWLREVYRVDALVHMGKHGNLEWLPGKGNALSAACWPDIALGPLPHFYPFIVNDPGEGAQAKRRAQAVIVDHLMPPLARAESYGELAELEGLVDEYYQALGMDKAREDWLRQRIVEQMETSHLRQELALAQDADEAAMLAQLDAYLCDIKEAQIRHGLHRLGQLPPAAKLAETLLALLRLPRGEGAVEQGLLHCLAQDLGLMASQPDYDPLELSVAPWMGPRPALLAQQGDVTWRTAADTREKLEQLALHLLESTVCGAVDSLESLRASLPCACVVLAYAGEVLLPALKRGVAQEIGALLEGLEGGFVEPGPSGAPSRGRLDTLPTGRNFFSVDNRAIPSAAAWAIGKRAAQAFIDRHLQAQGDYPRQVGLSVWGTATMRTGGDDIAQALALMGVRPVWAAGSRRVVDVEIVPAQLLGRPRIDVTLRVSGFFRDAFPNVIRLYDTAVRALASYDDPGGLNRVREHIDSQAQLLCQQGTHPDVARRQASYRVFGSKPGAYGAGLQGLIDERCWERRRDLAEAYLNWGGYAYGNEAQERDGVAARSAFANRLQQLDSVLHNQDNREHDLLDSDDYYQFQGGMINAVTELSGHAPATYHGDHSHPARPVIRTLKQELNRVLRSRVLNPKWISAMREHGYKGAFEMAATVDYVFAYDATTNLIDDYQYQQVAQSLVFDPDNQAFLRRHNPAALEEMAERLLEAGQRGMWSDAQDSADQLQELLLDIDAGKERA